MGQLESLTKLDLSDNNFGLVAATELALSIRKHVGELFVSEYPCNICGL